MLLSVQDVIVLRVSDIVSGSTSSVVKLSITRYDC